MTDQFQLLEQLGRGGMGVVWKARNLESGQLVALKLIHGLYAEDPDYVARFQREVEVAQRMDSPHIVHVFGFGRREGVPYMVMEYVDGPSLKDAIKEHGPYSWDETKTLAIQMATALDAAHAAGVIHRDMKPSNILMAADGSARLADFGIARAGDLTQLTGTSTNLGTPAYMSPDGGGDAQSDLYALGCVLYEMLAGHPPFAGETQQQILLAHLRDEPDLSAIPQQSRRVVGWLLKKRPTERPASAEALVAVLQGTSRVPLGFTLVPRTRSRRVAAGAGVLGVVLLGAMVPVFVLSAGGGAPKPVAPVTVSPTATPTGPTSQPSLGPTATATATGTATPTDVPATPEPSPTATPLPNTPTPAPLPPTPTPVPPTPTPVPPTATPPPPPTGTATPPPAAVDTLSLVSLSPPSGSVLKMGDRVICTVNYSTTIAKGVRIWAEVVNFRSEPGSFWFVNPSPIYFASDSTNQCFFGMDTNAPPGGGSITAVRITMQRDDRDAGGTTVVVRQIDIPVSYTFLGAQPTATPCPTATPPRGTAVPGRC